MGHFVKCVGLILLCFYYLTHDHGFRYNNYNKERLHFLVYRFCVLSALIQDYYLHWNSIGLMIL